MENHQILNGCIEFSCTLIHNLQSLQGFGSHSSRIGFFILETFELQSADILCTVSGKVEKSLMQTKIFSGAEIIQTASSGRQNADK